MVRDEEVQGAWDDFEFHGEAGERLAVDLGVQRISVQRLANDAVGFVEMHALGAAKVPHPERRQVAQIAQAALRGESHDFELILEKIRARGDLKGASVILRAADDGKRDVEFSIADDNAKMRELVAEHFASDLPPG